MKLYKDDIENLERVMLIINADRSKHFTIMELCAAANMGATKFKSLFKQYTGMAPYVYFKANRMKYAYELITETEYPIKLIAKKSGFKHVGNFCTAFKKRFGKTAGSFRSGD